MRIPDDVDLIQYLADASLLEGQVIRWGSHWADDLADLAQHGKRIWGDCLPWSKTHGSFRLRPGELTIWAGINGHRKSMILGQIMLNIAKDSPVCIASLEMKPEETLMRMCRQAASCYPSASFARKFAAWCEERICIYDQLDTVEEARILGMVYYAAKELGCKHVVIDSLSKCGLPEADYAAEKKFVDRLQWAAKTLKVHVHLVCHMRKGMSEDRVPNKFDVKGTGGITDMADNVVIVWKDKAKEQAAKKQQAGQPLSDKELEAMSSPDQKMIVEKQRHGDWEGAFKFWFDDSSLQFLGDESRGPIPMDIAGQDREPLNAPEWEVYE